MPRRASRREFGALSPWRTCVAWPNLTLLRDGTIVAVLFNQPSHGQAEGDLECWASGDGLKWERRGVVTRHEPGTVRMNQAAGLARNGDLVVLCSGWTDLPTAGRPKQPTFRDAVIRSWVLRSADGGRTWERRDAFPAAEAGWTEHIPFGDIWAGDDGALHTSCYQGEFSDPAKSSKIKGWRSWHFRSADDGRTWQPVSLIGPRHNETDLFPLGGKSWLAAARIDATELIRSDDDGVTWQEPRRVTEPERNQRPPRPAQGWPPALELRRSRRRTPRRLCQAQWRRRPDLGRAPAAGPYRGRR